MWRIYVTLLDPGIVVIGGGLMDHEVTTPEFRERYLRIIHETAAPYLWPEQRAGIKIFPPFWANCRRPSAPRSWRFTKAVVELAPRVGYPDNSMTLTEKILARAAGKPIVQAGDNIWVNADVLMTHDVCGPGTIGVFKREFGKDAKVWDKNKIVIIPDHYIFTADSKSNRNVDILREFVKEQGLPYFYDVIDDPNGHWHFDPSKGI